MELNCLSQLTLIAVICSFLPLSSSGYNYAVYVLHRNGTQWASVLECEASGATFGASLGMNVEITACGKFTEPLDACSPVKPVKSLEHQSENGTDNRLCVAYFGLSRRGNCTFAKKAFEAQQARYDVAIIVNKENTPLQTMSGDDEFADRVKISVFMVSYTCGRQIKENYPYTKGYVLMIRSFYSYDLIKYLIPFVAVVGFCFVIMLAAMVIKFVRDRRRLARRRLSRRNLRKLPTKKYKKGEEPETCPICLDDFDDGDKLRVLPCKHMYHTKCVDPWLTKNRKVCPVCKRKVLPGSGDSSDSEEEHANAAAGHPPGLTQGTPLLTPDSTPFTVGNSMFYAQYQSNGSSDEQRGEEQYATQPSSPDLDDIPGPSSSESSRRSSSGRRPKPRVVVPGFTGVSQERLVVPVPPEYNPGTENRGYNSDEPREGAVARPEDMVDVSAFKQTRPRRKRHPAANSRAGDEAGLLANPPTMDSESGGEETGHIPSSETPEPLLKKTKKKKKSGAERKQRGRRVTPASAPASLPDVSSVVATADISIGLERENSLGVDGESPTSQNQTGKKEENAYCNDAYVV